MYIDLQCIVDDETKHHNEVKKCGEKLLCMLFNLVYDVFGDHLNVILIFLHF